MKKNDKDGILTIDPVLKPTVNIASTWLEHAPHVDGSYQLKPEKNSYASM